VCVRLRLELAFGLLGHASFSVASGAAFYSEGFGAEFALMNSVRNLCGSGAQARFLLCFRRQPRGFMGLES
jgi:hypothetical protein